MTEKLILTWEDIERDTLALAEKISKGFPYTKDIQIVCVARGGLFIGGLISYALGVKSLHCVSLTSYLEEGSSGQSKVIQVTDFLPTADPTKTYLFVDDVNDTSETYKFIKNKVDELGLIAYFGVTYHKKRSKNLLPDFYGRELDENSWIVFPWDSISK